MFNSFGMLHQEKSGNPGGPLNFSMTLWCNSINFYAMKKIASQVMLDFST
jgi:hypothetical protein